MVGCVFLVWCGCWLGGWWFVVWMVFGWLFVVLLYLVVWVCVDVCLVWCICVLCLFGLCVGCVSFVGLGFRLVGISVVCSWLGVVFWFCVGLLFFVYCGIWRLVVMFVGNVGLVVLVGVCWWREGWIGWLLLYVFCWFVGGGGLVLVGWVWIIGFVWCCWCWWWMWMWYVGWWLGWLFFFCLVVLVVLVF